MSLDNNDLADKELESDNFLEIRPNELDKDWVMQARFYRKYACLLADAKRAHETAGMHLDVIDAELDRDIRANPEEFGLEKVTEPSIKQTILLQDKHQRAHKRVIEEQHAVGVLQATVTALDTKNMDLKTWESWRSPDSMRSRAPPGLTTR